MPRPGKTPEITTEQDTITFVMRVSIREGHQARLLIRCQRDGEIVVSLHPASPPPGRANE
jgi:hypothetical protein